MKKMFVVFISVALVSCQKKEKPPIVLTQTQLASLLVDIYQAEARTDGISQPKDSTIRYFIPFEQKLLKGRGVSDSALRETYAYYMSKPKELEQVYDAVIDTLVLREQRIGSASSIKPVAPVETNKAKGQIIPGKGLKPNPPQLKRPPRPINKTPKKKLTPVI